jgi:cellobiose transport system substrate-binding protein
MRNSGIVASLTGLALVLTACGGSDSADPNAPITLSINVYGDNFSLSDNRSLYDEYERTHPNIKIVENRSDLPTHHQNLQARLTAGSGAADLEVIEIGQVSGFTGQSDKFVNFKDEGVDTAQWTEATVKHASTTDGSALIGLPTDVGGLGMCYRTDLFAQAGLPTNRDEVSALWPTWEKYVEVGDQFLAKATGPKWFDSGGHVLTGILGNEQETYYNANGDLIVEQNPAVRKAWDLTVKAIKSGQSAALPEFETEWNTGFQQSQFATVTCPAWMMGYVQSNAPETAGKWDIAKIPGGSGNWGGSYLSVPTQGKHVDAAVELAKWLTAPEQNIKLFKLIGNFPSQKSTWSLPEVADYKSEFFSNAPAGKIFPASLENSPAQVYGPQSRIIGTTFASALNAVERGTDPASAWESAMKDIKAAAGDG